MPIIVNSPSTINPMMSNNGSPASPAPPRQPPHSPAVLAQPSQHVAQSVHMHSVPGRWQSAHILITIGRKKKKKKLSREEIGNSYKKKKRKKIFQLDSQHTTKLNIYKVCPYPG